MEQLNPSSNWLLRMAATEDGTDVSAGGLVAAAKSQSSTAELRRRIIARLIGLARRRHGLSLEEVAARCNADPLEVFQLEHAEIDLADRRVAVDLAQALAIPELSLVALTSLKPARDKRLLEAIRRFAVRSEPVVSLSDDEEEALSEFEQELAGATADD